MPDRTAPWPRRPARAPSRTSAWHQAASGKRALAHHPGAAGRRRLRGARRRRRARRSSGASAPGVIADRSRARGAASGCARRGGRAPRAGTQRRLHGARRSGARPWSSPTCATASRRSRRAPWRGALAEAGAHAGADRRGGPAACERSTTRASAGCPVGPAAVGRARERGPRAARRRPRCGAGCRTSDGSTTSWSFAPSRRRGRDALDDLPRAALDELGLELHEREDRARRRTGRGAGARGRVELARGGRRAWR